MLHIVNKGIWGEDLEISKGSQQNIWPFQNNEEIFSKTLVCFGIVNLCAGSGKMLAAIYRLQVTKATSRFLPASLKYVYYLLHPALILLSPPIKKKEKKRTWSRDGLAFSVVKVAC